MILEDDEPNSLSLAASAVSALVDAGTDSTSEPNKPTDPPSCNAWYDLESGGYIVEDSLPPQLEQDSLASTLSQHYHSGSYSPASPQDQVKQPDDGNTRTPEEPVPHMVSKSLDEDVREEMDENGCQLQRELLLAFEEQENPTLAIAPSSTHPHRQSTEPPAAQISQELNQIGTDNGGLEELRRGSALRGQHREEVMEESPEQRQQVAVNAMQEMEDGNESKQEQEAPSEIHTTESSSCTHNTNDEGNEDEELRPAKRRRQDSVRELGSDIQTPKSNSEDEEDQEPQPANWRRMLRFQNMDKAPTPLDDHSTSPRLRQSHSATPPPTQPRIDGAQPLADPDNPSTLVDNDERYVSRTSRSPSATQESVPAAEYCKWPFQGFLKRTRIGNETIYNLEFQLPCISEHLRLPISAEAFGTGPRQEVSAEPTARGKTSPHCKVHTAASPSQKKRTPWTPEEDVKLLKMKEEGRSWEDIHAALSHRSKGSIQVRYSTKLKE